MLCQFEKRANIENPGKYPVFEEIKSNSCLIPQKILGTVR